MVSLGTFLSLIKLLKSLNDANIYQSNKLEIKND